MSLLFLQSLPFFSSIPYTLSLSLSAFLLLSFFRSLFFHLFIFFLFSSNSLLLPLCIFPLSFSVFPFPFLYSIIHSSFLLPCFYLHYSLFLHSSHGFMSYLLSSLFLALSFSYIVLSHNHFLSIRISTFIRCACSITVIDAKSKISKLSSNFDLVCLVSLRANAIEKCTIVTSLELCVR